MNPNEKYIQRSTRTSHKRLESMVVYSLHYALRDVLIVSQQPVFVAGRDAPFYIDAYVPALNLAIEVDEPHHNRYIEEDRYREDQIKRKLGCDFLRITTDASVYAQVDRAVELVKSRVEEYGIPPWVHVPKQSNLRNGEYKENHIAQLQENGVPELVDALREELANEGNRVVEGNVYGIPSPANGEIGFLVHREGYVFAFYARASGRLNVRVMKLPEDASADVVEKLHPRQKRKNGCRYYALPDNKNGYPDVSTAKGKYYEFIGLVERGEVGAVT